MTIRVEIEGRGQVAEFPDGTPQAVIDAAIRRDFFSLRAKDSVIPETQSGSAGGWADHPMTQAVIGAGKGIINTLANAPVLPVIGAPNLLDIAGAAGADTSQFQEALKPENTPQKVGQFVESAAEFAGGEAAVAKVATKVAPALAKAPTALRSIAGAVGGAGVTAAQGGEAEEIATNAAIGGVAPWAFAALGKGIKALGQKVQSSVIRGGQDFHVETLDKYALGGSLNATATKTAAAIRERLSALEAELQAGGAQVDARLALAEAERELTARPGQLFGIRTNVNNAIAKLGDELGEVSPTGQMDILTAQDVKRGAGNLGAWKNGVRDDDASAMEMVANVFYTKMRQAIEAASGGGRVGQINAELSELIPVENAVIRRIPVAARNNPISLGEIIAIAHGNAPLVAAQIALKRGETGQALVAGGKALMGGMPKTTALAQAGVMTADPFGHDQAVEAATAEVQQQSGGDTAIARQIMGGKRQVYVGPDGTETAVPASVSLAFANGDKNDTIQKWLAAMQKQGKIKPGGHLAFVNQE